MRPTHPVLQQLEAVRRRANLMTLQVGVFHGMAATAAVVTACVVALPIASPEAFRTVVGATVAAVVTLAVAAAAWTRLRWLELEQAALRIDRAAGLQDRLSTWLFATSRNDKPGTVEVLSTQLTSAGASWQPTVLLPRAVARLPAATCALSLGALIAALVFVGPPSSPASPSGNTASSGNDGGAVSADAAKGAESSALPGLAMRTGSAPQRRDDLGPGRSGVDESNASPGKAEDTGEAESPEVGVDDRGDLAQIESNRRDHDANEEARPSTRQPRDTSGRLSPEEAPARGPARSSEPVSSKPSDSFEGAPPAAGGGTGSGRLFGTEGLPPTDPRQKFKLTLTAFLETTSGGSEPQSDASRRRRLRDRADGDMNLEQRDDELLHKPEIPPELEDVVRRVYVREERAEGER